jgi:hypothetical protein
LIPFLVAAEQQPMHLLLSSNNAKSLEDAKCLAENLLDTISMECGASRYSILYFHRVYDVSQVFFSSQGGKRRKYLFFLNISFYHIETKHFVENPIFYF